VSQLPDAANCTCLPAEEEERWRRWVDDRFVRVITINIYRNARESFQTFEYIAEHGNFSWPERQGARVIGAGMMWALSGAKPGLAVSACPRSHLPCGTNGIERRPFVRLVSPATKSRGQPACMKPAGLGAKRSMSLGAKRSMRSLCRPEDSIRLMLTQVRVAGKLKKKYDVKGEPRAEMYADAEQWVAAVGDRPFMGGDAPNLADLSVFGVVRSVTGTDTFMDLLHNTGISKWCGLVASSRPDRGHA